MSGNQPGERKGGRQKGVPNHATQAVREIAGKHGIAAIAIIAKLMQDENKDIQLRACALMLDRAYGKPAQEQIHSGDADHPIEIRLSFKSGI